MTIPDYEPRADEVSIPLSPGMVLCPCGWTYEGNDTLTAYAAHTEEAHR